MPAFCRYFCQKQLCRSKLQHFLLSVQTCIFHYIPLLQLCTYTNSYASMSTAFDCPPVVSNFFFLHFVLQSSCQTTAQQHSRTSTCRFDSAFRSLTFPAAVLLLLQAEWFFCYYILPLIFLLFFTTSSLSYASLFYSPLPWKRFVCSAEVESLWPTWASSELSFK